MLKKLMDYASKHFIQKISLSVSKDNYAMKLYKQQGFQECVDTGDAF
jgi:ribosomal protein S18 acetylase RimI-like enzyme